MTMTFSRESFQLYQVYVTKIGMTVMTQKANHGKVFIELVCGFS